MKQRMIIALLLVAGIVIAAQSALLKTTYLPVVVHQGGNNDPTSTGTRTPTVTVTPTPTTTNTPTSTPTATLTTEPLPTVQVNSMVEIEMSGPTSTGMGSPNPFLIEVEVIFTGPEEQIYAVQGFYDGDGAGGMNGSVWKVRFTPDEPGVWTYTSTSTEPLLEDHSGSFNAINPTGCTPYPAGGMPDFDCVGRLEYTGKHYLMFGSGQYWFKGGVNDPEDFLREGVTMGFATKEDAIDYLVSKGANSLYMLFNNLGGDGSNLYPWVGDNSTEAQANHKRFDVARLADWEEIFDYLQSNGIVLHLVFEDDSAWTGFDRDLYYRQMVARFGHYNGLIWNIAEEFNESYPNADDIKSFAQMIKDLDPYDHPLTVHQEGALSIWDPFLGDSRFDLTSFQHPLSPMTLSDHNANAVEWFGKVEDSGRPILVSFDEIRYIVPPPYPPEPPLDVAESRHVIWGVYMGGANYELRIWPDDVYSYLDFDPHLTDLHRAREFMEQLPYWQMQPMNNLLEAGQGYVFANPGEVYSVYLPAGGQIDLDLTGITATFDGDWFNPRDGTYQSIGLVTSGNIETFTAPSTEDWVLLLK
ncbi:DUF5060 domain-containing protein [Chloroflexota bacterium]